MKYLESKEQIALFEWASYFPKLKWMMHIPNGGYRKPREAARLKAEGVRAGVYDVLLPLPMPPYNGLWLELKRSDGKGRLSPKQKEFKSDMEAKGYKCVVCLGTGAAIEAITEYAKL